MKIIANMVTHLADIVLTRADSLSRKKKGPGNEQTLRYGVGKLKASYLFLFIRRHLSVVIFSSTLTNFISIVNVPESRKSSEFSTRIWWEIALRLNCVDVFPPIYTFYVAISGRCTFSIGELERSKWIRIFTLFPLTMAFAKTNYRKL